jgi:hypothetical protein
MVAFLLVFDNILNQLLGILLPFPLPADFILDVVLVEVRLVHNPFYYQLLQVLRKTKELFLIDRVD